MLEARKIAIIGGGIAGLASARLLAARGADVTVFEQAAEITEVGAGLQISPNGLKVLQAMGLAEGLKRDAVEASAVRLKDYRGGSVVRLDLKALEARGYYCVHRADLIGLLAEGARDAGAHVRLLQKVEHVEGGPEPTLTFASGSKARFDLIIGADGVHSVVRPALNEASVPFFTGHAAWRAVVPNICGRKDEVFVHMGPLRHVVSYPLRGGELLNIVAVEEQSAWVGESWSLKDDPENLRRAFSDFGPEVQDMLREVRDVGYWGLFRHEVAARWYSERVALIGDAAHPTLPFMAQGAVMGLEDAWALAASLERAESLEAGLARYQAVREARARRVVNTATGNARKYHLSFPPLRFAAHTALKLGGALAPGLMMRQFDWLYGYDITQEI